MKKLLLFVFILTSSLSFGQDFQGLQTALLKPLKKAQNQVKSLDLLSDQELISYWSNAQKQGYTLNQLKTLARAQGVSESDIAKFEKRIKKLNAIDNSTKSENEISKVENDLTSIFGISKATIKLEEKEDSYNGLNIFGMSFFKSFRSLKSSTTSPQINVATPSSYQLGPGDELIISVWGASENEYTALVTREGVIKIDRIGPVYVSGSTILNAKKKIGRALSKIYSGINSSSESYQKVFFEVNLAKSRSIIVNLVGEVERPGAYTFSSMSSVLNALSAAGGPTENGSFRSIQILRSGKLYKTVDLYNYFVKGLYPSLTLRDQDVILVPSYKNRVFVSGEFKTTGIFEFLHNEKISNLISFTGGLSSFAYKEELFVESISGINKSVQTVPLASFQETVVRDGDRIEAKPISDKFINKVAIEGAVFVPGNYSIQDASTVFDLITLSQGPKEDALLSRAVIYRQVDGKESEMLSFSVSDILSKKTNLNLTPNDRVSVFSKNKIEDKLFVSITGEVNKGQKYPFYKGMTVADLILMANGIKSTASLISIDVFRANDINRGEVPFVSLSANLNKGFNALSLNKNPTLKQEDLVVVRTIAGVFSAEFVTIEGLVKNPGLYSLLSAKYSLYNLLNDAGGVLENAALNGIKIKRINLSKVAIQNALEKETDTLKLYFNNNKKFLEFGVDVESLFKTKGQDPRYNVVLKKGDIISVPKVDNTILVVGEVGQATTVLSFEKNMRANSAIKRAGGFNNLAKKSGVFVVYQNGNIKSTKSFLLFNVWPKLEPGAKVVVPKKLPNPNKTSFTEIIGLTSTLATLTVLLRSL